MSATDTSSEPSPARQEEPGPAGPRPEGLVRGAASKIVDLQTWGTQTTRWDTFICCLQVYSPVLSNKGTLHGGFSERFVLMGN